MDLEIIKCFSEVEEKDQSDFIIKNGSGNFFQTLDAFKVFENTINFQPGIIIVKKENTIIGSWQFLTQTENGWLKKRLSTRTIVYGGPLINEMDPVEKGEIFKTLLRGLIDHNKRSIYIQIRNFTDMQEFRKIFSDFAFSYVDNLNYMIPLENREKVFGRFKAEKRRQIRKSLSQGTLIKEPLDISEVKEFYKLLQNIYKTRVKKPFPDWSLFKSFYELKVGKFLLIEFQNKIIGGAFCPVYEEDVIYDWYRGGLDKQFPKQYPSTMAVWAGIEFGLKHKIKNYDFMGAGRKSLEYSVRKFKSQFGGELVEYGRFERINKKILYEFGRTVIKLLQKII